MARQYEENGMKLMELERNIYGNAAPAAQNQWNANANNPYQGQQQQHSQWQQQQTPNNPYSQQRMQSAVPDAEKPLTRRDIEALEVERRNQEYVRSIKTQWDEKAASAKSERQRAAIEDAFKKASRDVEKNPAIFAVLSACAKQANGAEILRALQAGTGENDYRTLRGDQLMAKALDYGQQIVRARAQPTKSVSAPTPKGSVPKGKPSSAKMSYKEYLESKTATTPAPRK
jgi:hypothetical protein